MQVEWAPRAASDLYRIGIHIAHHNPASAERIVRTIYDGCNALYLFPGQSRVSRMPRRRDLVFAPLPYIAVYRVRETQVEILRIYHSARDWP